MRWGMGQGPRASRMRPAFGQRRARGGGGDVMGRRAAAASCVGDESVVRDAGCEP
jgi:hypothetical protein